MWTSLGIMHKQLVEMLIVLRDREGGTRIAEEHESLWNLTRQLDLLLDNARASLDLDLTGSDESVREALRDFLAWRCFTPHPLDDPGDVCVPTCTPEEAGLDVFFLHGRWLATWMCHEESRDHPECELRELLVFEPQAGRLQFVGV